MLVAAAIAIPEVAVIRPAWVVDQMQEKIKVLEAISLATREWNLEAALKAVLVQGQVAYPMLG